MEADGDDDAEEGVMAYRQVGRRRVATLAMGDRACCRVLVPDNQTDFNGGRDRGKR